MPECADRHKPKAAIRILSADFLKNSLSAPSTVFKFPFLRLLRFSNFPFCVICLYGPLWAFLRVCGYFLSFCASNAAQALSARFWRVLDGRSAPVRKKPLSAPPAKRNRNPGRLPPWAVPFLQRRSCHAFCYPVRESPFCAVLPSTFCPASFLCVFVPFCPFAGKRAFLRLSGKHFPESRIPFCTF